MLSRTEPGTTRKKQPAAFRVTENPKGCNTWRWLYATIRFKWRVRLEIIKLVGVRMHIYWPDCTCWISFFQLPKVHRRHELIVGWPTCPACLQGDRKFRTPSVGMLHLRNTKQHLRRPAGMTSSHHVRWQSSLEVIGYFYNDGYGQ